MDDNPQPVEGPEEKAHRLTESLRGRLKEEFAQFGADDFLRWVRGYDEEERVDPSGVDSSAQS